jgi:hypothetical protein
MGKPASAIKKKEEFKSPISPLWLGMSISFPFLQLCATRVGSGG